MSKCFSHSVGGLFMPLIVSFEAQKALNFDEVNLSIFSFIASVFGIVCKK